MEDFPALSQLTCQLAARALHPLHMHPPDVRK